MRSSRAFSTLRILPRRGRIACVLRLLAFLALPPAESPSTRKISQFAGSLSEQSESLPGRAADSSGLLRRAASLALRAASRARWERMDFYAATIKESFTGAGFAFESFKTLDGRNEKQARERVKDSRNMRKSGETMLEGCNHL